MRTPIQVQTSVWKALFLREALTRLMDGRAGWLWIILEPLAHALILAVVFETLRQRLMPGMHFSQFVLTGVFAWNFFNKPFFRGMVAIQANKSLFTYRQVKPIDTVLVRGVVEGLLNLFVFGFVILLMEIYGWSYLPIDPLGILVVFTVLWFFGLGLGLCTSVLTSLFANAEKIVNLIKMPLYFSSGIFYMVNNLPDGLKTLLLYNPVIHGVELARGAMFEFYHVDHQVSLGYLAMWALPMFFLGMVLQVRFERDLVME
jgi:capsular polysaccharide transport system permease protein